MKVDAHTAWDEGFDVKLMEDMQDNWTTVPIMRNLHVFDWVCPDGHRRYQGPSGECKDCGKPTTKDIVWIAKTSPQSTSFRFDKTLHFNYFGQYKKIQDASGSHLVESMSLQGSCFMLTREKYWELNICDEAHGSWGQQGTEVACKTWLSGGRVVVNKNTWYAHMFRTQGGDFGFPYPLSGNQVDRARKYSRELWLGNTWPLAIHPLSWLIEKFAPVPDWEDVKPSNRGMIFFTDNALPLKIAHKVQDRLKEISKQKGIPIVSASLKPMDKMGTNIVVNKPRGIETMFEQILLALEASTAEIIYFAEHDVLYDASHFDFTPEKQDTFYYNVNWYKIHSDGVAVSWEAAQVSGLVCYRELAIKWYREKLASAINGTFNRSYEPKDKFETFKSTIPYIDVRHEGTLTRNKRSLDDFRNKDSAKNFTQTTIDKIPGWDGELLKKLY